MNIKWSHDLRARVNSEVKSACGQDTREANLSFEKVVSAQQSSSASMCDSLGSNSTFLLNGRSICVMFLLGATIFFSSDDTFLSSKHVMLSQSMPRHRVL